MKHRRGVADVIAALVLIFITIIAAGAVYVIATNYAGRLSNNVGVQITSAQITSIPNGESVLTFTVANTGTVPEVFDVSTGAQTFSIGDFYMRMWVYTAPYQGDWSLLPYPYTGSIPQGYVEYLNNWTTSNYNYVFEYSGSALGMPDEPWPPYLSIMNNGGISSGYISTGSFIVSQTTTYTFQTEVDDGMAIWINGPSTNGQWVEVFGGAAWHSEGATSYSATENLQPGVYQLAIIYENQGGPGMAAIKITPTINTIIQPGQTVTETFILSQSFTPGQSVTLTATAYSISSGTATTATTVLVS